MLLLPKYFFKKKKTFFGTHCSFKLDASKFRNGQASAGSDVGAWGQGDTYTNLHYVHYFNRAADYTHHITACPPSGFLDLPTALAGIQEKKPFSQVGGYNFSSQKLKGIDNTVESFTDVWQLNYSGCGVLIWNRRISSSSIEYKTWNRMLVQKVS